MVFGRQFRPASGALVPGGSPAGGSGKMRDRAAAFLMSVFLGMMLLLMLGGCGSGSDNGGNTTNNNNGGQTTRLLGRVLDNNSSGVAVSGATVTYGNISGVTDNAGNFSIVVPAGVSANLTVVGPALADGSAGYYNTYNVGSGQFSNTGNPFPVPPLTSGEQRNLGTILIYGQSGPPPPPPI